MPGASAPPLRRKLRVHLASWTQDERTGNLPYPIHLGRYEALPSAFIYSRAGKLPTEAMEGGAMPRQNIERGATPRHGHPFQLI